MYKFDFRKKTILNLNKNLSNFKSYFSNSGLKDLNKPPGVEHYQLFIALSEQLKYGKILEIGTHQGNASVALSYGKTIGNSINIYTYDIKNLLDKNPKQYFEKYGIIYKLENLFDPSIRESNKEFILSMDIILIDIDPHEGILEKNMLDWLKENDYKGIILFDDIHLGLGHTANNYRSTENKMSDFWKNIDDKIKIDLTKVGHWSGTGLVSFNLKDYDIELD